MSEAVPYGNKPIRKPEDHDWTGKLCTFMAKAKDGGGLEIDAETGCVLAGELKVSGTVVGQEYRGLSGIGSIPDFTIEVEGSSGAVVKIGLLENNFQVVD